MRQESAGRSLRTRNNHDDFCTVKTRKPHGFIEWIDYMQKNKPQTNALVVGVMVIVYGGQNAGWGIFNNHLLAQPWATGYEDKGTVFWAITSWFIAAITGFFIATIFVDRFTKMTIYTASAILSSLSAAMLILQPASIYYIFPARILCGVSHGITYVTILIHASEVSIARLRGMVVGTVHLCLVIGVFITSSSLMPVFGARSYEIDPTKTIGFNGLICVLSGLLLGIFFNRESPVFYIRRYCDQDALNVMMQLRSESHVTQEIRQDLDELKIMVAEDYQSDSCIISRKNLRPLLAIITLRIIFVASFNMPLNLILLESIEVHLYDGLNDTSGMVLSGFRWVAVMTAMFFIDFGRKKVYIVSSAMSGTLLILMAQLLTDSTGSFITLACAFQTFSGLAIGSIADIYSAEAFNTKLKAKSIAFTTSIEFAAQILLIVIYYYMNIRDESILLMCGLVLITGVFIMYKLPDTSGMSLRNARNKFTKG